MFFADMKPAALLSTAILAYTIKYVNPLITKYVWWICFFLN